MSIIVHLKQLLRFIFNNFEGHISNANTVHEFGKYSGNAIEYVFINNSISAPGDYKLYSLEHSSTAFLLKLLRYRKPPNIRPGVIFVGKDFLMGLYNRGGGGGEGAYVWGAYIRATFGVSNNIYCTCKLYRERREI